MAQIISAHSTTNKQKLLVVILILTLIISILNAQQVTSSINLGKAEKFLSNQHSNNWAVLVCSSRYWFNYRHVANVLSVYRSIKRFGIDDSHIILMLADDIACDARNPWPATIFNNAHHHINVYGDDVEVDYRGEDVTVENFIRLLTGRVTTGTPRSKQLLSDAGSNILIYLTGHGGNGFLKFQDKGELTSTELADSFEQMHQKQRYNEILFIVDTCQAESMSLDLYSPNIIGIGSSKIGEDSLSHHGDSAIGVYIIDRYTYYLLNFLEAIDPEKASNRTLNEFFKVCPKEVCMSNVQIRKDLYKRDTSKVSIMSFFGNKLEQKLINIEDDSLWESML